MNSDIPLIIFVLLPERTAFNASFTLARRLVEAGYRVSYIGPRVYQGHVTAQGFAYVILFPDPLLPDPSSEDPKSRLVRWWRRWREINQGFQNDQDDLFASMPAMEDWLRHNSPCLALLDPLMWEFAPPLLKRRVPIVGICSTLTAKFDINIPPVFSESIPEGEIGTRARLRNLFEWSKVLMQIVARYAQEDLTRIFTYGPLQVRNYRPKSLVKMLGGTLRYGEYGLRLDVPELVLAPRAIDLQQSAIQDQRAYAGSCVDGGRNDGDFNWGSIEKGKPLIYCSLGTYSRFYKHRKRLILALINALRDDNRWQAIIHIGDAITEQEFGNLPPRIMLTKFAAQLDVLRHASIFITHGGFGSIREGAFFGVPMIVFPCWLDQFGNAARVVHHRIGLRGHIDTIDAPQMRGLLERIQTAELRSGTRRMQVIFQHHQSCQAGLDWIKNFLSTTGMTTTPPDC